MASGGRPSTAVEMANPLSAPGMPGVDKARSPSSVEKRRMTTTKGVPMSRGTAGSAAEAFTSTVETRSTLREAIGMANLSLREWILFVCLLIFVVSPLGSFFAEVGGGDLTCEFNACRTGFQYSENTTMCVPQDNCPDGQSLDPLAGSCAVRYPCDGGATFAFTDNCAVSYRCGEHPPSLDGTQCVPYVATGECLYDESNADSSLLWDGANCIRQQISCQEKYDLVLGMVLVGLFALLVQVGLVVGVYFRLKAERRSDAAGRDAGPDGHITLESLTNHWIFEIGQACFTALGCLSYTWYTYKVTFATAAVDGVQYYGYVPEVGVSFLRYVLMEIMLISAFGFDYLIRLTAAADKFKYVFNFYGFVDLAAYAFVIWSPILQSSRMAYSLYMFGGTFRILRFRRSVSALDDMRQGDLDLKMGFLTITARTAALMMLAVRIILYILCSASLMMFFEYPCVGLYPEDADSRCNSDFQRFHLAFYYVICTFSTVGYGDMYPTTDAGRMLGCILIVVMLIQVPVQIAEVSQFFDDDEDDIAKMDARLMRLGNDIRGRLGIATPSEDVADNEAREARARGEKQVARLDPQGMISAMLQNMSEAKLKAMCVSLGIRFLSRRDAAEELLKAQFGENLFDNASSGGGGGGDAHYPGMIGLVADGAHHGRSSHHGNRRMSMS